MDQKTNEKYKAANGTIDKTVPGATNPPAPEKPELVAPTPSLQGAHRQEHLAAPHLLPGSQPLCPPSAGKPDPSPTAALITTVVLVPLSVPLTPRAPSVSHLCMSPATQGLSHGRGSFILEQTKHKSNRLTHRAMGKLQNEANGFHPSVRKGWFFESEDVPQLRTGDGTMVPPPRSLPSGPGLNDGPGPRQQVPEEK